MQRDHPLSQRNMTTEKTMRTGAGGGREVGGGGECLEKIEKRSVCVCVGGGGGSS